MPTSMPGGTLRSTHAFGVPTASIKNHLYALGDGARIFTSPWIVTKPELRHYAAIYLTARGAPVTLTLDGTTAPYQAAALKQMTERAVRAQDVQVLLFQLDPLHRHFARFRAIARPGLLALDRQRFARLDTQLQAAYAGRFTVAQASELFDDVVDTVLPLLPPVKDLDARVLKVIELLRQDHNSRLDRLAAAVDLSYDRLSHLFAESMGLPLRTYQSWLKLYTAITLVRADAKLRLTDVAHAAGFADSSHLCKAFVQAHGAPPSYFLDSDYVTIISAGRGHRLSTARELLGATTCRADEVLV